MARLYFVIGALASLTQAVPSPNAAAADCPRAELVKAADAYVAAQKAGSLDPLASFVAEKWGYVENNKDIDPKKAVVSKPLKIDHRRTITDPILCASFTELIVANDAVPYVIGTQIRHDSTSLKVTLIDSVASTTGSWLFNAKQTLQYASQEKWDPIPEAKWDSRQLIQLAGDAYLDLWSNATAEKSIPWGAPCVRLEGGQYTGKSDQTTDTCKQGTPSNHNQAPNSRRRYVIDQSMGSVSILCLWEHMMNAADSHEFRLENGHLRYVHTMTECGGKTCRLG